MHEAIARMLSKYECQGLNDYINGLREILQEVALLGLWRSKFFEKAAFYGGTALRVIYGLDRFSEDMDFSLLEPSNRFDIARYTAYLAKEIKAFGFDVRVERIDKARSSPVQSAFLKADTRNQLLVIETGEEILQAIPNQAGSGYRSAPRFYDSDPFPPAAYTFCGACLCPPGFVRR